MTYQELFKDLREEFAKSADKYIKTEKQLTDANGFLDINLLSNFIKDKQAFELASNNYYEFLNYVKDQNINPNDKLSTILTNRYANNS